MITAMMLAGVYGEVNENDTLNCAAIDALGIACQIAE